MDATTEKRGRGRPKGSKAKETTTKTVSATKSRPAKEKKIALTAASGNAAAEGKVERRGRPKGTKNKVTKSSDKSAAKPKPVIAGEKRSRGRPSKSGAKNAKLPSGDSVDADADAEDQLKAGVEGDAEEKIEAVANPFTFTEDGGDDSHEDNTKEEA